MEIKGGEKKQDWAPASYSRRLGLEWTPVFHLILR